MKRFYNRPGRAQGKFSRYAYRMHLRNLRPTAQRGGTRL